MELKRSQHGISPETAEILMQAMLSGDPSHYHPEVQESHPSFDPSIEKLHLEELGKLFQTLEREVNILRAKLTRWESQIPWEKETWSVTDANLLKHVKSLITLEGKLDHLKTDVKKVILKKITDHFAYCLMQVGEA